MKQWRDWPDGNHFIILMVPPKKKYLKKTTRKSCWHVINGCILVCGVRALPHRHWIVIAAFCAGAMTSWWRAPAPSIISFTLLSFLKCWTACRIGLLYDTFVIRRKTPDIGADGLCYPADDVHQFSRHNTKEKRIEKSLDSFVVVDTVVCFLTRKRVPLRVCSIR